MALPQYVLKAAAKVYEAWAEMYVNGASDEDVIVALGGLKEALIRADSLGMRQAMRGADSIWKALDRDPDIV